MQNPLSADITHLFAVNCMDGAIDLHISGGFPPYRVQWYKNGQLFGDEAVSDGDDGSEDLSGLGIGKYRVEVYDALCGFATALYPVGPQFNLIQLIDIQQVSWCSPVNPNGSGGYVSHMDGSITIQINSDQAYTVSWTGPNGFTSNEESIDQLCAGTYTVTVQNGAGCQSSMSFDICCCVGIDYIQEKEDIGGLRVQQCPVMQGEVPVCDGTISYPLSISEGEWQSPADAGVACDGYINPGVFGGNIQTAYQWTLPGGGISYAQSLSQLCPGTYCLTVSDGCSEASRCWTLVDCSESPMNISFNTTPTCSGYAVGSASVSVSGGTPPYRYTWSNGKWSALINDLVSGTYFITVSDAHRCTSVGSVYIDNVNTVTVRDECVFYTYCEGNLVNTVDIGQFSIVREDDCRYLDFYCTDYFYIRSEYHGTYEVYDGYCTIYEVCNLNDAVYDIHYGQIQYEQLIGFNQSSNCWWCHIVEYCYFPHNQSVHPLRLYSYLAISFFPPGSMGCDEQACFTRIHCDNQIIYEYCDPECNTSACGFQDLGFIAVEIDTIITFDGQDILSRQFEYHKDENVSIQFTMEEFDRTLADIRDQLIQFKFQDEAELNPHETSDFLLDFYPNPSNGLITLDITGNVDITDLLIEVYTPDGQICNYVISDLDVSSKRLLLQIFTHSSGIYFIKIMSNGRTKWRKITLIK